MKLGYNELSVVNEHFVITNRFFGQIGYFTTQINPVITNPGDTEQKWLVPSCSLLQVFTPNLQTFILHDAGFLTFYSAFSFRPLRIRTLSSMPDTMSMSLTQIYPKISRKREKLNFTKDKLLPQQQCVSWTWAS